MVLRRLAPASWVARAVVLGLLQPWQLQPVALCSSDSAECACPPSCIDPQHLQIEADIHEYLTRTCVQSDTIDIALVDLSECYQFLCQPAQVLSRAYTVGVNRTSFCGQHGVQIHHENLQGIDQDEEGCATRSTSWTRTWKLVARVRKCAAQVNDIRPR